MLNIILFSGLAVLHL